jgi:hypothetical protein
MHLKLEVFKEVDSTALKYLWRWDIVHCIHMLKQFKNVNCNSMNNNYFYCLKTYLKLFISFRKLELHIEI